jgi:YegS/Rv2252/BmrU family lipid kinase
MRIILVANPRSGRGDGHSVTERVRSTLAAAGHECEVRWTDTTFNGRVIARETAVSADLLVVLGGDGSLFEVVNGIMDTAHRPRLAQIPVGTGNSFIKDLGINSVDDGLAAILGGKLRAVDLGRFTSSSGTYYFINLMGAGFVARVARLAGRFRFLGAFSYTLAVLLLLIPLKARRLEVMADGVPSVRDALFVELCNSKKTGGDMIIAPDAEVDDGLLDVIIAKAMNRRQVLALFPQIFKGTHVHSPLVESFKCRTLTARFDTLEPVSPDGEQTGDTPLSAEVVPRALELYTL